MNINEKGRKQLSTGFLDRLLRFVRFQFYYRIRNARYFFLRLSRSILVKDIQGSKMRLNLKDEGISKDLALDGIREPESTQEVKRMLKEGDVVIEVGANIGYYALIESRLVGEKGRIYAVEPSPYNVDNLKRNIKLNNIKNIEVFELAIGDKDGVAELNVSPHSNLNSLIRQDNKKIIEAIKVKVMALDNFLKDKKLPDFLRMDVEGYEASILKGMGKLLRSKHPMDLFIEIHPHIMRRKETVYLLKTLKKHGFETRKVIRSLTVAELRVMPKRLYNFSSYSIDDLLDYSDLLEGKLGAFEVFFGRG